MGAAGRESREGGLGICLVIETDTECTVSEIDICTFA